MSERTWIEPYGAELVICASPREWRRARKRFGKEALPSDPGLCGRTSFLEHDTSGKAAFVVWINVANHDSARDAMLTAVHEAVHVSCGVLDHVGQKYDGSSEALAYLVDWVTSEMWEHIRPHCERRGMLPESNA